VPNFDSGTYFLTTLIPVDLAPLEETVGSQKTWTSPVHALRKDIARLPTAWQTPETTPANKNEISPFARCRRTHFARFVVIDDAMFVGRQTHNAALAVLVPGLVAKLPFVSDEFKIAAQNYWNPIVPQPHDRLSSPYLFFSADFDAASGSDAERDSCLKALWEKSGADLFKIFQHCQKFKSEVQPEYKAEPGVAEKFAAYVAKCQVETTMPFHDYYRDNVQFDALQSPSLLKVFGPPAGAGVAAFVLLEWLFGGLLGSGFGLILALTLALIAAIVAGYFWVVQLGQAPLPTPDQATLPDVLKSLWVRNRFTPFTIDNQLRSVDPRRAQELHDAFGKFLGEINLHNTDDPATTQPPGVIGF
jgi:hypothetical protein